MYDRWLEAWLRTAAQKWNQVARELSPNTTLSHYRIESKIGSGGMGEVYLAEDGRLGRKVALKILPEEFAGDSNQMSRFVREAKTASALNHPNILTIHEIGESDGRHYIATEFIAGETLRERIRRGRLSISDSLDIAVQVATALQAAHDAGIIHRDIKPENVIIRADGLLKVLDFGLAKSRETPMLDSGETHAEVHTKQGIILGTVAYMSPEQSRGKTVDHRTDIWSLGVVIYEMLSGRQPFTGETTTDTLVEILTANPASVTVQRDDTPAEFAAIVAKTLAKNVHERYGTTQGLLADLKSLRKRLDFETELERQSSPGLPSTSTRDLQAATMARSSALHAMDPRHSIAVMPFTNMSADVENEYFCDGLAEELLNALAKIDDLKVAARTSAFSFKGKSTNISEIGRTLGVKVILEGSVRKSGNRLRISVQIVNAADGYQMWSERYDREIQDIFDVQDEITLAVVDVLKVKVFGIEKGAALKRGTENPQAYQLYLKGRFFWNKMSGESLKQAVEFYSQAIARDPNYALAYAGLAESYVLFSWLSVEPPRSSMPKAKAAALRALELDDSLAEAHAALGVYLSFFAWDQKASERSLRRAIELNPNHATAFHWLGNIPLLAMGPLEDSLAMVRRAEALDPLSPIISSDAGVSLLFARRYDEAIAQFHHALGLDPNFYVARYNLGQTYHAKGMFPEAIAEYCKSLVLDDDPWVKALLSRSLAASGMRDEAAKLRDELKSESSHRYVPNVGFAIVQGALGEMDEAFHWLEKDFEERSLFPPVYAVEPVLDDLRADPRFADLIRRVELAKMD